jgi:hypothetical protein
MNPELPSPQSAPESQPSEQQTERPLQTPELAGNRSVEQEQNMQQVDRQAAPQPVMPFVAPPPLPVPVPVPVQPAADDTAGPTIAGDDDLIEKEWVDKAKSIIAATRDDPYKREQEINKLQADYLRKRYGKELGISN